MKHDKILLSASLLLAGVLMILPSCRRSSEKEEIAAETVKDTVYPLGFCTDSFSVQSGTVKNGEVFTVLMKRVGMDFSEAHLMASAVDSVFDPRKMRAGRDWQAYYDRDSAATLRYLVYSQDRVNSTVFDCRPPYRAWLSAKPVDIVRDHADVTIQSSLWNDMLAADVSPLLIIGLSDVYAWTIDFFGLQKGDRFRVLYDKEVCEGEVIDIKGIAYAVFEREGKEWPAVLFDQGDGGNVYWNEKGESMRKAFLKAPLKFSRISSGFTYRRKHPVHGGYRPHTGIDYAAPSGTPVMSIGDGTVISRGYAGGGGNTVKIRHNSVYTTAYMHLSRYASGLKVGDRVSQGQVIGYVGSTGTSTGPHLDFRVWMNGSPINPLKMESPPTDPVVDSLRPKFDSVLLVRQQEMAQVAE